MSASEVIVIALAAYGGLLVTLFTRGVVSEICGWNRSLDLLVAVASLLAVVVVPLGVLALGAGHLWLLHQVGAPTWWIVGAGVVGIAFAIYATWRTVGGASEPPP